MKFFNETLTNDVVSFEQPGPDFLGQIFFSLIHSELYIMEALQRGVVRSFLFFTCSWLAFKPGLKSRPKRLSLTFLASIEPFSQNGHSDKMYLSDKIDNYQWMILKYF